MDRLPWKDLEILVAGCASGIGREVVLEVSKYRPKKLYLLDRDLDGLVALEEKIVRDASDAVKVVKFVCDIRDQQSLTKIRDELVTSKLSVFINSIGVVSAGVFEKQEWKEFNDILQLNLIDNIRLIHILLPQLLAQKNSQIIQVASLAGCIGAPGFSAYTAAKFGMLGFLEALRIELEQRVSISIICPTFVNTPLAQGQLHASFMEQSKRAEKFTALHSVLRKIGSSPNKVAKEVIRTLETKKPFVPVNVNAHVLYHLHRFFPQTSQKITASLYNWIGKGWLNE